MFKIQTHYKVVAVFMLIVAITLVSGKTVYAAFPGQNGQIAWSDYEVISQNEAKVPLSRMNFNGTPQEDIFADGAWAGPRYSADGNKIVVSSNPITANGQIEDIYTLNPDGTNLQNLTNYNSADHLERSSFNVAFPSFHPNGARVVYGTNWEEDFGDGQVDVWGIAGIDTDGSNENYIIAPSPDTCDMYPVYSPDGSRIAFYRGDKVNNTSGIYTMDADGTNISELIQISATEASCSDSFSFVLPFALNSNSTVTSGFDWSPDGQHIVYATVEGADDGNGGLVITTQINKTDLLANVQTVIEQESLLPDEGTVQGDFPLKFLMTAQYTPEGEIIFKQIDETLSYELNITDPADASVTVSVMLINDDGTNLRSISSRPEVRLSEIGELAIYEVYRYLLPSVQPVTSETLDWRLNGTDSETGTITDATLAATGQSTVFSTIAVASMLTFAAVSLAFKKRYDI